MKYLSIILLSLFIFGACTKVQPGYQAVKVHLHGDDKGDGEVLPNGRYSTLNWNVQYFKFPTFEQNYIFTSDVREGSENDESFTFQSSEGVIISLDAGISYTIEDVKQVFYTYRRGIDEITDVFLRNMIRDGFNRYGSSMSVDSLYSDGKVTLLDSVYDYVSAEAAESGINVSRVYLIGNFNFPKEVNEAINFKITADQRATARELQRREAIAQAEIDREKAQGEADAVLIRAKAEAESNRLISASISSVLTQYKALEVWNGELPQVTSDNVPFINLQ